MENLAERRRKRSVNRVVALIKHFEEKTAGSDVFDYIMAEAELIGHIRTLYRSANNGMSDKSKDEWIDMAIEKLNINELNISWEKMLLRLGAGKI